MPLRRYGTDPHYCGANRIYPVLPGSPGDSSVDGNVDGNRKLCRYVIPRQQGILFYSAESDNSSLLILIFSIYNFGGMLYNILYFILFFLQIFFFS